MNKRLFLAAILVTIMPTLWSSVVAQEHGPPAGGSDKNLREAASDLKGRSVEMDRVRKDTEKRDGEKRATAKSEGSSVPKFSEIKEDFERIQIINSDVLQASPSSGTLDYERFSESAAELNKRAIRLKSNLFQPESGKQEKKTEPGPEDQELKALLTLLDNSIIAFTQSPMFQNTKVVNREDSIATQKDLENIIKLSARIRLEADRIKKTNSPPK